MSLLANPYALIGAGLLFLAAIGGSYFQGRADGRHVIEAQQARANAKAIAGMEKARDAIDVVSGRLAASRTAQQTEAREIWHESIKIIDRPVYRSVCGDASGTELFERARSAANAGIDGGHAQSAAGASHDAP